MTVNELRKIIDSMSGHEEVLFNAGDAYNLPVRGFHFEGENRLVLRHHVIQIAKTEFTSHDGLVYEVDAVGIQYQNRFTKG